jgi:hypothetical protein
MLQGDVLLVLRDGLWLGLLVQLEATAWLAGNDVASAVLRKLLMLQAAAAMLPRWSRQSAVAP